MGTNSLNQDDTFKVEALTVNEVAVTATALEINQAADPDSRVQELTASGAVTAGVQSVELNHATVAVDATIATAVGHPGLLVIKNTSASGTAAHTVTLTAGTFNAANNNKVTLNAPDEFIAFYIDSAGSGEMLVNYGTVALSTV